MSIRYAHTNLVVQDLESQAAFYRDVFGYRPIEAVRNLRGEWFDRGTGISGAVARVQHLRLPAGTGNSEATLELMQYVPVAHGNLPVPNRCGYGHLAFVVDDVPTMRERVLAAGGSAVGTVESVGVPGRGVVTWTYVRDPEGNIVELQQVTPAVE